MRKGGRGFNIMIRFKKRIENHLTIYHEPKLLHLLKVCLQILRVFQNACLLCGKHKDGGDAINALIVGDEKSVLYASSVLFQCRPHRLRLGKVFIYAVNLRFSRLLGRIDLIIATTTLSWSAYWRKRGYFLLPKWANFTCNTANSGGKFLKTRTVLRQDINKVLKRGFSCEITYDKDKFYFFYKNIYLPYISARFNAMAAIPDQDTALYYFQKGGLLLVKQNGEYAAGAIFAATRNRFLFMMSAPAAAPVKHGGGRSLAMTATYYYALRLAKKKGYQQVDFGGCLPFLNNGLFYFKKKWGMKIGLQALATQEHAFKVLRLNTNTRDLLAGNPFVFHGKTGLNGMVFINTPEPVTGAQVLSCLKKYWTNGLREMRVASFSGFAAAGTELAGIKNLKLVSADSPEALTACRQTS